MHTQKAPDARLELVVLSCVDERVDAAIHHDHCHVYIFMNTGTRHFRNDADQHQQLEDASRRPAHDEAAADHQ